MIKCIIITTFLIFGFVVSHVYPSQTYGNVTVNNVISVYDGDTIRVNIDGYPDILGENISIRLFGIDTPEIRDKNIFVKEKAYFARKYLKNRIENGKEIVLKDIRRGKYFRIVGVLYIDGENICYEMVDKGLAKEYYGGKKPSW